MKNSLRSTFLLFLGALLLVPQLRAAEPPVEGMWLPLLLKEMNISDMQAKGLKLSAEDIYSVNQGSLKDAIVSFGGFCTGSVISNEGLLITNHHCGFGQIQSHSSVENDYLTDGFWAKTQSDELTNPGLTATFIVRIEDVTEEVLKGTNADMSAAERDAIASQNIKKAEAAAVEGTHYGAQIKPFFYGNEYYMFVTETFRDVRLVGAPPSAIGKFGGDTDNWMWPRHTGDFSLFRIYAGKDNMPADYSEDNVPLKPRKHLDINLKPRKKGDFTMVFGFPGRTQEYLTSHAVDHIYSVANPAKIQLREERLEIMDAEMRKSDKVRIQYAAKYARVSNYHKKWIGENRGLKKLNAVEVKQQEEAAFSKWANANASRKAKYGNILPRMKELYGKSANLSLVRDYLNEAAFGMEFVNLAYRMMALELAANGDADQETIDAELAKAKSRAESHFKDYHAPIDHKVTAAMMAHLYNDIDKSLHPQVLTDLHAKYKGDWGKYADYLFKKSILTSEERTMDFLDGFKASQGKKLKKDPAYALMNGILGHFRQQIAPVYYSIEDEKDQLYRDYVEGLREMQPNTKFYPDANSTLRLTYGQVDDYEPMDGAFYHYYTTLDGILEKHASGNEDYELPERMVKLAKARDYGNYGQDGELLVCFTGSNHTTGGNSGSPVLDAEGRLIGVNFDRNWEGTMSDIMYDPDRCRNITVDIGYVLWVVDKYASSGHLLKEMNIIR